MTSFTLYPAIDLKDGKCVRLVHGQMDKATVYNDDPAGQALLFAEAGFDWVHMVDLDGAFAGESRNANAIEKILTATNLKTQLGGGIRTMEDVGYWLSHGVSRVIIGTAAVKDSAFVRDAARAFPDQIVVGIDAKDGRVKTDGWDGDTGHDATEIAKRFEGDGVTAIIYTDIGRDGALGGVNLESTSRLAQSVSIPVIASGGVAGIGDVEKLIGAGQGVEGVIIGRALYDGRIDPNSALKAANSAKFL